MLQLIKLFWFPIAKHSYCFIVGLYRRYNILFDVQSRATLTRKHRCWISLSLKVISFQCYPPSRLALEKRPKGTSGTVFSTINHCGIASKSKFALHPSSLVFSVNIVSQISVELPLVCPNMLEEKWVNYFIHVFVYLEVSDKPRIIVLISYF